jgi:hypothetical protein
MPVKKRRTSRWLGWNTENCRREEHSLHTQRWIIDLARAVVAPAACCGRRGGEGAAAGILAVPLIALVLVASGGDRRC